MPPNPPSTAITGPFTVAAWGWTSFDLGDNALVGEDWVLDLYQDRHVNGSLVASTPASNIRDDEQRITIGARGGGGNPFGGLIDEVQIYDRPLSESEIGAIYDAGAAGVCKCLDGPDTDVDGRCDPVDNCPTVANGNQADADPDGVGDACDLDALQFDGVDDYARVANNPAFRPGTGSWTVEGWVLLRAYGPVAVIAMCADGNFSEGWQLDIAQQAGFHFIVDDGTYEPTLGEIYRVGSKSPPESSPH